MEQARFNFLLIAFIVLVIGALAAVGYAIAAAAELKAERQRSREFKQMYEGALERQKKLIAENSVFRLYIQTFEADKRLQGGRIWQSK